MSLLRRLQSPLERPDISCAQSAGADAAMALCTAQTCVLVKRMLQRLAALLALAALVTSTLASEAPAAWATNLPSATIRYYSGADPDFDFDECNATTGEQWFVWTADAGSGVSYSASSFSHPSPGSAIFAVCFQCPQTVDGSAVAWDGVAGQNVSVVKCQDLGADGYTYADPISSYTFTWSPAPVAASSPSSPSSNSGYNYVWRMVSVPYSRADFTHAKQVVFIRAVAAVAGAQVSDLDISTISVSTP